MSMPHLLFLLIVFAVVVGLGWMAIALFWGDPVRRRLAGMAQPEAPPAAGWVEKVAKVAKPLMKLSAPEEGWEKSPLRSRFMNAGWRGPSAVPLFFASKTALALLCPLLAAAALNAHMELIGKNELLLIFLICASIGYYFPNMLLQRVIERRQREILENFPDALDLLTVCVEAGLSLDAALMRVAGEIHIKSEVLAQELQLVLIEMRAGFGREKALRNLALRSSVDDIDTLVAMLIQADRFGTSMGGSLRVHAENLRVKRRQRAEEAAAKISLKLLFPLTFCIFPTLMLVLLGPAFIQIYRVLLPALAGSQ